jgi:peptidoglycan hydrolase-like protein with peptidoglycan-binding domain
MEPQQARLTFAVFVALSVVIVFNALYLQNDAGFATRAVFDHASPDGAVGEGGEAREPQKQKGSSLLRAIRRELSQHNYFPGNANSRLDGRVDAMTMGAIMAYQYDSGLAVTGRARDALLKSFLFGVGDKVRRQGEMVELSEDTRPLVAEIQGILSAKGHYSGKIDGIFRKQTMEAIRRFESDRGLPVTGRVSGLLIQELTRMTGVAFSSSQK